MPKDITVGQFLYIIRKNIKMDETKALFIYINNMMLPAMSDTMGSLYEKHADKDKFLYVTFASENTFGKNFKYIGENIEYIGAKCGDTSTNIIKFGKNCWKYVW